MKFSKLIADRYAEEIDLDFSKIEETAILKSILSRRSIRKFLKKPISKELLTLLLAASICSVKIKPSTILNFSDSRSKY